MNIIFSPITQAKLNPFSTFITKVSLLGNAIYPVADLHCYGGRPGGFLWENTFYIFCSFHDFVRQYAFSLLPLTTPGISCVKAIFHTTSMSQNLGMMLEMASDCIHPSRQDRWPQESGCGIRLTICRMQRAKSSPWKQRHKRQAIMPSASDKYMPTTLWPHNQQFQLNLSKVDFYSQPNPSSCWACQLT